MPGECFKGHVATDYFLLGTAGKWRACGWSVVQLDYDEELGPLHGMYGSTEVEYEVQRTIKRGELTAFLCMLMKDIGPIKVHDDNKELLMGYGLEKEKGSVRKLALLTDLWIKNWEQLHHFVSRDLVVEVEHVNAHRTKKDKNDMSHLERFVTEGNEKADELAKEGAMLDEGFMAEAKTKTMQQEREEVYTVLQYAASFHCLVEEGKDCEELRPKPKEKWTFVDKKREENETSNRKVCPGQEVPM